MDRLELDSKTRSWSMAALRGWWIPALVVVLWLPMISRHLVMGERLGGDAPIYVDCARSIVEGRGFMTRYWGSLGDELWHPMRAFPPGYPLLIASGMVVGFTAYNASLIISVLSGTVFLFMAVRLMADRLPAGLAILGGFVLAFMQPYLFVSTVIGSDALYLPLMLVSLLLLVKATRSNDEIHLGWAVAAGVLAGAGYTVRNAAVALMVASFGYLLLQRVCLSWTGVARGVVAWGVGCGLGGGWLVGHNLISLGGDQSLFNASVRAHVA